MDLAYQDAQLIARDSQADFINILILRIPTQPYGKTGSEAIRQNRSDWVGLGWSFLENGIRRYHSTVKIVASLVDRRLLSSCPGLNKIKKELQQVEKESGAGTDRAKPSHAAPKLHQPP